jgi:TPR repeat protein
MNTKILVILLLFAGFNNINANPLNSNYINNHINNLKKSCNTDNLSDCLTLIDILEIRELPTDDEIVKFVRNIESASESQKIALWKEDFNKESFIFIKKACNLGDAKSYGKIGGMYKNIKEWNEAVSYYKQSCTKEYPSGCITLALFYKRQFNNMDKYKTYLQKACDYGKRLACKKLKRI